MMYAPPGKSLVNTSPTRDFPKGLAQMIVSIPEAIPADTVKWLSHLGNRSRDDFYHAYRVLRTACGGDG